jgi:hypothetical protein
MAPSSLSRLLPPTPASDSPDLQIPPDPYNHIHSTEQRSAMERPAPLTTEHGLAKLNPLKDESRHELEKIRSLYVR